MTRRPLLLALLVVVLVGCPLWVARGEAQGSTTWTFENRSYFDPAVAEIHAPDMTVMVLGQGSELQYSAKPGRRRAWTISLGKEVPLFGRETKVGVPAQTCFESVATPAKGCSGWGVWFAVDFHMLEDFKDDSNPIVDTDYRFGGTFKYRRQLTDTTALGLRGYYGHESTHLGDEFSLAAQRNRATTDFQRINVSYQYWEYGASYDVIRVTPTSDPLVSVNQVFKFRHLGSFLDPFTSWKDGYYSTDPLEVNGHTVTKSKNRYEPTFEFEWNRSVTGHQWEPYVSADLRYRTIFNYAKVDPNAADDRQWSTNLIGGYRRSRVESKRGEPDFFARLYYGVNPYGQLRNQRNYFLIGAGVHVFV
jgi:hypothetical protein